jgi:hypothetical protein
MQLVKRTFLTIVLVIFGALILCCIIKDVQICESLDAIDAEIERINRILEENFPLYDSSLGPQENLPCVLKWDAVPKCV